VPPTDGREVRVIAGLAKGHPLVAPRGRGTRPTADRVREAVFSSLLPHLPGARVLDLYAGSGALGIEALSRGAAHATFVERDRGALRAIADNLDTTGLGDRAEVVAADVRSALGRLAGAQEPFDVVLLDPPYRVDPDELAEALAGVAGVVGPAGLVRLEQAKGAPEVTWPPPLVGGRERRYGDTRILEAAVDSTGNTERT
jgi:16S rRNA (guanine966-N2)-methyltransferase